jgi:hypothetical protein
MSVTAFTSQLNLGQNLEAAKVWVLSELGPVLAKGGYRVTASFGESVSFTRRSLPGWALVLGIITLPVGILILALVRRSDVLIIDLSLRDGVVLATVSGVGPKMVRDLFDKLNREGVAVHTLDPAHSPEEER